MSSRRKRATSATTSGSEDHLLQRARLLIANGSHTTASLAKALGVSTATTSRLVQRLRRSGAAIGSVKRGRRWFFVLEDDEAVARAWEHDPFLRGVGLIRGVQPPGHDVDDALYRQE